MEHAKQLRTLVMYAIRPMEVTESGKRELGRRLERYRKDRGMTFRDAEAYILERCGKPISFNSIRAIEKGHRSIELDTLFLLVQSGYGGMSKDEMMDILTDRRLTMCEKGVSYICN